MQKYIKEMIGNHERCLDKIQEAIQECGENSLWTVVVYLEDGKFELIDRIENLNKQLNEYK